MVIQQLVFFLATTEGMAIRHGNTYMQILLDPNRAELLANLADGLKVRPTSWIRDVIYKELERVFLRRLMAKHSKG